MKSTYIQDDEPAFYHTKKIQADNDDDKYVLVRL